MGNGLNVYMCVYFCKNKDHKSNLNLNQRTNGPVNTHLICWPSKAQDIQNIENIW